MIGLAEGPKSAREVRVLARRKIVVIEDEPDILEFIEYNLGREGYAVSTASDGESGLDLVRREGMLLILELSAPVELGRVELGGDSAEHIPHWMQSNDWRAALAMSPRMAELMYPITSISIGHARVQVLHPTHFITSG